jgi:hypothetical protein
VRQGAWKAYFKYTYYEGVEAYKYRCFVQYNLAKEAWGGEEFEIGGGEMRRNGEAGEGERGMFRVSTAAFGKGKVEGGMFERRGGEKSEGDGGENDEEKVEQEGEAPVLLLELEDLPMEMPKETLKESNNKEVVEEDAKADPFKVCSQLLRPSYELTRTRRLSLLMSGASSFSWLRSTKW